LQDHLETIRQAEIDRVRGRLGPLSPEQELAIETLTRGIVNKIMHTPITALKMAAHEPQATTVIDIARRLFNLEGRDQKEKKKAAESGGGESGAKS
jgi:glutamyl-tRNA reductase